MKNSLLLIGLCIILLAVPVLAEQPWDGYNNASSKYILNITTTHSTINENFTFKMWVNGSELSLESDCSDLFITYQDTVEVDRAYEGNCQSADKDALNVSWKMRASGTINANTSDEDWSIWTDPLSGEVPSDNKFLVYAFFDDFNALTINDSKWDCDGACSDTIVSTQPGMAMCSQDTSWSITMRTIPNFDGDWEIKADVNLTEVGGNTGSWGWCPASSIGTGGSTCPSPGGGDNFIRYGHHSPSNPVEMRRGGSAFESSVSWTKSTFFNSTIRKLYYGSQNGTWQWGGVFGGATKYNNNSAMTDPKFMCGGSDGNGGTIQMDSVAIHGVVPFDPTYTVNEANAGRSLYQLSPPDGSVQSGINTNFSCSGEILSIVGINITNITFRIYNPSDVLDNYTIFDVSAQETNDTIVSFVYNATIDGVWKYACDMTDTTNFIVSETNDTFTVDSGVPEITLIAPIIDGNTSIVISTYITTDATAISCYWSVDTSSNTSIACTPDGVETTTILDMSALIGYGGHNFIFYANDSLANNNSESIGFVVVERLDEQFPDSVLETDTLYFNLTIDDLTSSITSSNLEYDNTDYTGVLLETSGTQKTYGVTFGAPAVSGVETKFFNWTISGTYDGNSGSAIYPTSSHSVGNIEIVPTTDGATCDSASATIYTLNFTFRDESSNDLINGLNVTQYYNVWSDNPSSSLNFTWVEVHNGVGSYPVCIFPNYAQVYGNVKVIYGDEGDYAYREFNLQNHLLSNETQHYTLFNVNDSIATTITLNLVDENNFELQGYVIKAILVNYGNITNLEFEVESQITDINGQVLMELDASQYYKFEVWRNGVVVHTVEPPFILKETEYTISISLEEIISITTILGLQEITTSLLFDSLTGNITATWNDAEGLSSQMCLRVSQLNTTDPLSNECSTLSSGLLVYSVPSVNNTYYLAQMVATATLDENNYVIELLDLDFYDAYQKFGVSGLFWGGIILIGSLMTMGIFNPAVAIGVSLFGLIVMGYFLKVFFISWVALIGMIVIGLFLIVRLKS
jgi:hypothetical protein